MELPRETQNGLNFTMLEPSKNGALYSLRYRPSYMLPSQSVTGIASKDHLCDERSASVGFIHRCANNLRTICTIFDFRRTSRL